MITGSLVAIVTPMLDDGSLDYPRLRSLIDWHVAEGSDGIVIVGTTGESPTVDVDEHCELIRVAVEHAAGRLPVIAGTGANSTAEAVELARFAEQAGAAATPYLRLFALTSLGWLWARMALVAGARLQHDSAETVFYAAKLKTADFYMARILVETDALLAEVLAGKSTLMAFAEEEFAV